MKARRYNLKFWRLRQELTQEQVANTLGITREYYRAVENGVYEPSETLLDRFATSFGITRGEVEKMFTPGTAENHLLTEGRNML